MDARSVAAQPWPAKGADPSRNAVRSPVAVRSAHQTAQRLQGHPAVQDRSLGTGFPNLIGPPVYNPKSAQSAQRSSTQAGKPLQDAPPVYRPMQPTQPKAGPPRMPRLIGPPVYKPSLSPLPGNHAAQRKVGTVQVPKLIGPPVYRPPLSLAVQRMSGSIPGPRHMGPPVYRPVPGQAAQRKAGPGPMPALIGPPVYRPAEGGIAQRTVQPPAPRRLFPTIQREVVKAPQTTKMPYVTEEEASVVAKFAKHLDAFTEQAYKEIIDGSWLTKWGLSDAHMLDWMSVRGQEREHRAIGYAIESRVYQLLGGKEGKFEGYRWGSQGSVPSKGTRPDVFLVLEEKPNDRQALFDITSNLQYKTKGTLHILTKSPAWTSSSKVCYAAEVQYPAFSKEVLESLSTGVKLSEEQARILHEQLIVAQDLLYSNREQKRQEIMAIVEGLWQNDIGAGSKFKRFKDFFFDGSIMDNATTEANNFLRAWNIIGAVTGQPSTPKSKDAPLIALNDAYEEKLGDLPFDIVVKKKEESKEEELQEMYQ
jgi:hypothetical protein